jgi:predicted Ser/Thr protein kinase
MSPTPDELLIDLAAGRLSAQAAAEALQTIANDDPAGIAKLIVRVQQEVAAGRLPQGEAQMLLGVIERLIASLSSEYTLVQAPSDATSARTSVSIETMVSHGAPAQTLLRAALDELKTQVQTPPTEARTVDGPLLTHAAHTLTSKPPDDNTQVISERLVKSLDEIEAPRGALQPGSLVKKRFLLETLVGKGGMGLVFSAIDRRKEEALDPNPRVALKVLNGDFERHPQSFIALQREARKAQSLAHPNVVTVFDFDRDGESVYLTMELLKGRSLESFVREARGKGIAAAIAMPIIRGIAEGLAYAHRKGIVHSDLKPGNVFVIEDGTPKILDFGIARAVPSAQASDDVFDAGSLGAYTEAYATDEMIDGIDPHPADDMYALGIIGYELLTGHHPYQRHGAPTARSLGIKPPALRGLKHREAKALERCLSFERKDRPKDAGEFLQLFRGVSTLQKVSIAAAVVLAVTAGHFGYQNYVETSPAVPFAELPATAQQEFRDAMTEGDRAWKFFADEHNAAALNDAILFYSKAYAVHPRNRDAVRALRRAADPYLELHSANASERRQAAAFLQGSSDFFLKYEPAVEAAR